jgi:8-oxo-dGTP diphosphatase
VDVIVLTIVGDDLKVLLIRRGQEPFKGRWAIPGGFVEMDESLEAAARRELQEETGVKDVTGLEQLHTFGDPHRDPRGRTISVAYYVLLDSARLTVQAADDAAEAGWFSMFALPPLAFDHDVILAAALNHLRNQLHCSAVGRQLLPEQFTLPELQHIHEVILGHKLDPRAFRNQMLHRGRLEELAAARPTGSRRSPRLYRFIDPDLAN